MTDPFFTGVIPGFNRATSIAPTLRSVAGQSFNSFECIVVDDGSSDDKDLRSVVQNLGDTRFRYIRRENGGGSAARNTGIDAAIGGHIAFLDSDDLFMPEKLAYFAAYLKKSGVPAAYSRAYVDRGVNRKWIRPSRGIGATEPVSEYLFCANEFMQTSTLVVRRDIAARVRFDETLRKFQDYDFCLRLEADEGVKPVLLDEPLVIWSDQSDANRTSKQRGLEDTDRWIAKSGRLFTAKAAAGFRATAYAYLLSPKAPLVALWYIGVALLTRSVPVRVGTRQLLRCFLPRKFYRRLANALVTRLGHP